MNKCADGFVIPVPNEKLESCRATATEAGQIWREHGALDYKECVLEDPAVDCGLSFPQGIAARNGETVIFSWIVDESRVHRDAVNQRVLADPRIKAMCEGHEMPFDTKRVLYSGFDIIVDALADQPAVASAG